MGCAYVTMQDDSYHRLVWYGMVCRIPHMASDFPSFLGMIPDHVTCVRVPRGGHVIIDGAADINLKYVRDFLSYTFHPLSFQHLYLDALPVISKPRPHILHHRQRYIKSTNPTTIPSTQTPPQAIRTPFYALNPIPRLFVQLHSRLRQNGLSRPALKR